MNKYPVICLIFASILLVFPGCKSILGPEVKEFVNRIPFMLSLDGPSSVQVGVLYEFEAVGEDPDGHKIAYHFGTWFGDDYDETYKDLGWSEFKESKTPGMRQIAWNRIGEHTVCSYCRDTEGGEAKTHLTISVIVTE